MGSSYYKLEKWKSGQFIKLTRNVNSTQGQAKIDNLLSRIIPDKAAQFLELSADTVSYTHLPQDISEPDLTQENLNQENTTEDNINQDNIGNTLDTAPISDTTNETSNVITIESDDLWQRIKNGYTMPNSKSSLVSRHEDYYTSNPDYVRRMVERSQKYLFHIDVYKRQLIGTGIGAAVGAIYDITK